MTVGGDCMVYVVGFTTTYAIGAYHHLRWGVLDTILCDEDCLVTCDMPVVFSGDPVSSTNNLDRHEITDILVNVALKTTTLTTLLRSSEFLLLIAQQRIAKILFSAYMSIIKWNLHGLRTWFKHKNSCDIDNFVPEPFVLYNVSCPHSISRPSIS